MKISVDANNGKQEIVNFWNHIHFHPTDAAEDRWGREILNRIAEDHVAQYVRLHTMFEDIVTRSSSGNLQYDFTQSDARLDYMNSKGFRLLLCFDFMPPCMSSDMRNQSALRYKNKTYNRSAPTDWNEWKEVCETYTRHLTERYGRATVESWLFHCWNEPDAGYWLDPRGNDQCDAEKDSSKVEAYCKLYDYFEYAVSRVDPAIRVGGPSCAGSDHFISTFLKHTSSGKNAATGRVGTRLDFIGVHCYSQGIYSNLPNRSFTSPDNILQRLRTVRSIADRNGHAKTPMILDEFGIAGGGFLGIDRDPRMIFRETEYFSAFYAKLIDEILRSPELNLEKMMICLSGQDHCVKDFDGFRTFFTANGYAKPIYNGYRLAAKLGLSSELLSHTVTDPDGHTGIIPAKDRNGTIRLLCYHFEDDFYRKTPNTLLEISLKDLHGTFRVRHYRIDGETSNAYSKWSRMGNPTAPTMYQRSEIADAGDLSLFYPEASCFYDGTAEFTIAMTQNSVTLLEIEKQKF